MVAIEAFSGILPSGIPFRFSGIPVRGRRPRGTWPKHEEKGDACQSLRRSGSQEAQRRERRMRRRLGCYEVRESKGVISQILYIHTINQCIYLTFIQQNHFTMIVGHANPTITANISVMAGISCLFSYLPAVSRRSGV